MKREEASFKLYSEMSVKFGDSELATLFRKLASDEAKHKLIFEKIYDEWISSGN
ncbi:MAG: ferritin family protein [Candidatus Cloacimonadaceae bacterium]|nr:ferritin family protein [Candidatus Cloacimonadaceae bacterium]